MKHWSLIQPVVRLKKPKEWLCPTEEMLESPEFLAIWECIRTWDIAVPTAYDGTMGATGNHARAILEAIEKVCAILPKESECEEEG